MRSWKFIIASASLSKTGGVEKVTQDLTKHRFLKKRLKLVDLSINRPTSDYGKLSFKSFFVSIWQIFQLSYFLLDSDVKGMIITLPTKGLSFLKKYFMALIGSLLGKKIIFYYFSRYRFKKFYRNNFFLRPFIKSFLRLSDKIIILWDDVYLTDFESLIKKSKVEVIPNGIEVSTLKPSRKDLANRFNSQKINIVFIGRLTKAKGAHDLAQAYINLRKKYKADKLSLNLIGDTETIDSSLLKSLFFSKKNQNINFLGIKTGREKIDFLKQSDIFALPSYFEGLSIALLEGLAAGLPVVTCNKGSAQYFIDDGVNGYVSPAGDRLALVNNLEKLIIDNKLREEISRNNIKLAQKFDIDKVATSICKLMKNEIENDKK